MRDRQIDVMYKGVSIREVIEGSDDKQSVMILYGEDDDRPCMTWFCGNCSDCSVIDQQKGSEAALIVLTMV